MRKINYISNDGLYYKILETSIPEAEKKVPELRKAGRKVELIEKKGEGWLLFVSEPEQSLADPIVRIGKDDRRCPYCNDRVCLKEVVVSHSIYSEDNNSHRFLCKCVSQNKYFCVEYVSEYLLKSVLKKRCLMCNVKDSLDIHVLRTNQSGKSLVSPSELQRIKEKRAIKNEPSPLSKKLWEYVAHADKEKPLISVTIKCNACYLSDIFVVRESDLNKPENASYKEALKKKKK